MLGLITLFLLIIPIACAQNFTVSTKAVKDKVIKGDWAMFDLAITNEQGYTDVFKLSSKVEGTEWSILTESTFDYATGVTVTPHATKVVRMLLKDKGLEANPTKAYVVDLTIKSSNTGEKQTKIVQVFIVPNEGIPYLSDISGTLMVPRYIDPRNIYSFVVNLKNNNPKDIKNLNIRLESSLFTRDGTVELQPEMQKGVEFTVGFDENQKPTLDTLTVVATEDGKELYRETTPIEIVSYRISFEQETKVSKFFLKTIEEITLTNNEIVQKQQKFLYPLSPIDQYFVTSDPQGSLYEKDKKKNLAWDIRLAPGEATTLIVVSNYRLPFYIITVILILILLYLMFRHPILIVKHAEGVSVVEGGIKEFKVVLNVNNRSKNELKKVTVVDTIPHMIELDKKHDLGTLLPKKMLRTKKGTLLIWEFEMEPKEERLIKYIVKAKLSIVGSVTLPPASVFVHSEKSGRKRKIISNEVSISE
ncbi:hypothetical protein COV19_06885 [Candidatus Woesearchaeota archaeon CG10_big_fil_rev_8_21_14_0_10_44_13]|nr:MAG: hypothetical protein COV19_06885 [Candidatus Woesearchaeota archaeon CG10_big_fil_rev_8_21_14_0_10_44_13]